MTLIVKKFGGSSLANADRISHVADIIIKYQQQGHQLVIVVSAMFGETDRLIEFANGCLQGENAREYSVLVSTGEQVSMSLLCMALSSRGFNSRSFNGAQANIYTDSDHIGANILDIDCTKIKQCISNKQIAVVAGFQGVNSNGDITTLGRGGSDTTAVALAALLKADECYIYTDVDGIYSADPKLVPDAKQLKSIDHSEMLVLSHKGAKVMQPRSVELAGKYNMTVKVLSSFHTTSGTIITNMERDLEAPIVTAITCMRNLTKHSLSVLEDNQYVIDELLCKCHELNFTLEMVQFGALDDGSNKVNFSCVVQDNKSLNLTKIFDQYVESGVAISYNALNNLSILTAVGVGLRGHKSANIISLILQSLKKSSINYHGIGTGDINVLFLMSDHDIEEALRAVHDSLGLNTDNI